MGTGARGEKLPILLIILLLVPLGLWLLWNGWTEGAVIRIAIGATFLFVAIVVFGAFYISSRMRGARHREKLQQAALAEVDLAPGAGVRRGGGRKPSGAEEDPVAGEAGDAFDSDVGGLD